MAAYYNEIDPFAAQWLRNLIAAGHIAPGDVDERSIEDVRPDDIRGYTQCHWCAGIGIWSYSLRRSGWDDSRPIWTASIPCQPFSEAGQRLGFADERHLFPYFEHLARERRPAVILGEQVASKNADQWIDLVHADMEALDYSFGCVPFPAASIGAPHIRDRVYWLAHANNSIGRAEEPSWYIGNRAPAERNESYGNPWKRLHDADWKDYAASISAFPDGDSRRMGELRAYGNAINAIQAQVFIEVAMECIDNPRK